MKQFKRILFIKRNSHLIDLYNIVYNTKNKILLLLGILGFPLISIGQSYDVKNYSVKDGLPSSQIYNCMQDSKGYMWFSTDKGVSRFDGYSFQNYSTADGLADNTVFECIEDYKGRIWFRSFSGKLSYYYNDSIYKISINDSLTKIMHASCPVSMYIDSSDNLYIGAYSLPAGLIKYNLKSNKLSCIKMPSDGSYIIYTPGNSLIYGLTSDNTALSSDTAPHKKPLLQLYSLNKNGRLCSKEPSYSSSIIANTIHGKAILINNHLLALSFKNHFTILDTSLGKFKMIQDLKNEPIVNISKGRNGNIWLSTETHLFYIKDSTLTKPNLPSFIYKKNVTTVFEDKEGGVWITTLYGGVYYTGSISFVNYSTDNGLRGDKIIAFDITSNGNIWTAFEGNRTIDLISKDSIIHLPAAKRNVISINTDSCDNVWIGNSDGLTVLKKDHSPLFEISHNNDAGIFNIIPNKDNSCWTYEYSVLCKITPQGHSLIKTTVAKVNSKIFNICKSANGTVWIGSLRGLFKYSNDSLFNMGDKFPILKNRINDLKLSEYNDDLWMATRDTGLLIKHNNSIYHITTANGLLSNFCQCLCVDHLGNIWVGTNRGISHIIINKNNSAHPVDTIINITNPGLLEVNTIKARGDTIYAATSNGLTLFDMNKVSSNKVPPPVYITGIKINNQNKYISSAYNLKYDENYLIINFVGLTYKDAGNTQYRYKMEGIDTGWVYTKNRDVQYPKLPPGNYTFLVSAMNNDGVWNQHLASVTFFIAPPFWATWWARSIFILAIAGFIFWRFRIVTNRAKKEAEINKHLISMELKELKAQMDPHFLFNNLNTLTQLVEIKSDDAPEFVEELSRYYRYSLQFRNTEFTTLDNELKQAERYLHILKIRFGDNIHVTWNIRDELKNYYVATYSMQLLLENITKHNIVSASKPIWVNINTNTDGYLEVKNQYQPKNSSALSNKHGLKSIEQRYQLLIAKNINITQNSEVFSVQLPLISPTQYENIYS